MNWQTREFKLVHEDILLGLARDQELETLYEVQELLFNYMLELEKQVGLMHDPFLQELAYVGLQEIDVAIIEDSVCKMLEISPDEY